MRGKRQMQGELQQGDPKKTWVQYKDPSFPLILKFEYWNAVKVMPLLLQLRPPPLQKETHLSLQMRLLPLQMRLWPPALQHLCITIHLKQLYDYLMCELQLGVQLQSVWVLKHNKLVKLTSPVEARKGGVVSPLSIIYDCFSLAHICHQVPTVCYVPRHIMRYYSVPDDSNTPSSPGKCSKREADRNAIEEEKKWSQGL